MSDTYNSLPNDKSSTEVYFASDTAENLAGVCLQKAHSFYTTLSINYYLDQLVRQWLYYHGQYNATIAGDSHTISFTGEEGELVSLPVNHFRNIAENIINMITANRPVLEAAAINTDSKSLSQAILADGILDYYMREKKLEDAILKIVEMAVVLGSGFLRMEWNASAGELYDFDPDTGEKNYEGELEFTVHSPFDVVFDGTKENWASQEYVIIRSFQNRFNLAAKYPDQSEKILRMQTKQNSATYRLAVFSNDSTDDIPVYEFFHKKTPALPEGRYTLFLDSNLVLLDLPLPYQDIPIYRLVTSEYMGTCYGYTDMFDVFPIQEMFNANVSAIASNQSAFATQNLFVSHDSDLEINSLEGALNIIKGNTPPVPINLTQTPREVFDFTNMLVGWMETISGVNSVTRGNPEASLKSGTALALVQSMSIQFMSRLQNNYVKFIEDVGTSLLRILKDFALTPKTISLVGKNKRPLLKEAFTGDQIGQINRVIVSIGNPLSRTIAGRVQMAEQMMQMKLIQTPAQYFEVIETGNLDTMIESTMSHTLLIKRENEFLMEGRQVLADMLDNHPMHIQEHRTVLADPDLRMNPELRKNVQDHLQEHINYLRTVDPDLLAICGMQALSSIPPLDPPPLEGGPTPQQIQTMQQAAQQPPPPPPGMGPPGAGGPGIPGGKLPQMGGPMMPPNGLPNIQQSLTGQGSRGGNMIPQVARPPTPFQNLPVLASEAGAKG
jgi:hypothetical protein